MDVKNEKLIAAMAEWAIYNVAFSLVPLSAAVLVKKYSGQQIRAEDVLPEVLFFNISLSISTISSIHRIAVPEKFTLIKRIYPPSLLLVITMSAIIYGAHLHSQTRNIPGDTFSASLATIACGFALAIFLFCGMSEYYIGKNSINENQQD